MIIVVVILIIVIVIVTAVVVVIIIIPTMRRRSGKLVSAEWRGTVVATRRCDTYFPRHTAHTRMHQARPSQTRHDRHRQERQSSARYSDTMTYSNLLHKERSGKSGRGRGRRLLVLLAPVAAQTQHSTLETARRHRQSLCCLNAHEPRARWIGAP
jgi:hypothetical protein